MKNTWILHRTLKLANEYFILQVSFHLNVGFHQKLQIGIQNHSVLKIIIFISLFFF